MRVAGRLLALDRSELLPQLIAEEVPPEPE
jgi:hypothetical protein